MSDDLSFFFLLMSNGLLIGLMYSLIALGFVLVYKATDAINFAQGEFVMIAGFVAAGCLMVWGAPLWLAVTLAVASLVVFGFVLERVMLRRLIGRPVIAVVMATIGLASILRGVGRLVDEHEPERDQRIHQADQQAVRNQEEEEAEVVRHERPLPCRRPRGGLATGCSPGARPRR